MIVTHVSQTNIFAALYRPLEKVLLLRKDAVCMLLTEKKIVYFKMLCSHTIFKISQGYYPKC
jgi:hypothetical protein